MIKHLDVFRLIGFTWLVVAAIFFGLQMTRQPSIEINWSTESEQQTAGFHIYRSDSEIGPYERITSAMIPAQGSAFRGASYKFIDHRIATNQPYFYQLEEVELNAATIRYANETIKNRAVRFSWGEVVLTAVSAIIGTVLLVFSKANTRRSN